MTTKQKTTRAAKDLPDILYVADIAKKLGTTPGAIKAHVRRQTGVVPKPFRMGRKLAWYRVAVDAYIARKAGPQE